MRYCTVPSCRQLVEHGRCATHRQATERARGTRTERGYDNNWLRYSKDRLEEHPLCVGYPLGTHGTLPIPATVTDHILSAKERPDLFDSPSNHQSLCRECNVRKANELEGGFGRW